MTGHRKRPEGASKGREHGSVRSRPLSPVDLAWLRMEDPTNLMMVTALLLFDGPLDLKGVRSTLERRLLAYDRFRQRIVDRGRLVKRETWELDRRFDISSHLRRVALPAPGGEDELTELVSDLMSTPLDFSKPLWQVHLIESYGAGCAVLVRIHHAIADGIALIRVLLSLTDRDSDQRRRGLRLVRGHRAAESPRLHLLRGARRRARRATDLVAAVLRTEARMLSHPAEVLALARRGAAGASALGRLLLRAPDPKTVLKGSLGVPKRVAWSDPLLLADVKAVGRVTDATVNDVLVSAVTGALRHYLERRGDPVEELAFHAAVPVNLRPAERPSPSSPQTLGNRFGIVFLALPVSIANPLERLLTVRQRMLDLKRGPEAGVALGLLGTFGMTSSEIQKLLVEYIGAKTTTVLTNVVGPERTVFLAGRPVRSILFWVPQSGRVGLGFSILSYAGNVRLGIAADRGLVPDPEQIVTFFHREFDALRKSVEPESRRRAG